MTKVVINVCYSGFGLSDAALAMLPDGFTGRDDPRLVAVVEELGVKANGYFAELKVVAIPDDVSWHIEEYDGCEWVAEDHRTWN
jgi:hypothetical protein